VCRVSLLHQYFVINQNKKTMENIVVGFWNERKEILKQKFPGISDNDLQFNDGKEKEMMEMLGYKLGKSEDELRKIVNDIK